MRETIFSENHLHPEKLSPIYPSRPLALFYVLVELYRVRFEIFINILKRKVFADYTWAECTAKAFPIFSTKKFRGMWL